MIEAIQDIIDRRRGNGIYAGHGHIDILKKKKEDILQIKDSLLKYAFFFSQVQQQFKDQKGEFYFLFHNDPSIEVDLQHASPATILSTLDSALKELDLLEKRFDRSTINISVIGRARQGKSRLLQSISGLSDQIIPTSDGSDCTGAKSIICNDSNTKKTYAKIICYSEFELMTQIQAYLDSIGINFRLGSFSQVPLLKQEVDNLEKNKMDTLSAKQISWLIHLKKYIEHYNDYVTYVGRTIEESDQNKVRDYVAQYDAKMNATYTFLAVKEVQIYTKFPCEDVGNIVLVDTIGLGDTSIGIRDKMIKTLREDSDAAILVRLPAATGDHIDEQDNELYDLICKAMGEDALNQWLFYALNVCDFLKNQNSGQAMSQAMEAQHLKYAFTKVVNCGDSKAVEEQLLVPILKHLTQNLVMVDKNKIQRLNQILEVCNSQYVDLCNQLSNIVSGKCQSSPSGFVLFSQLYDSLNLSPSLKILNDKYHIQSVKSDVIEAEVRRILRSISTLCPSNEEIVTRLNSGNADSHPDNVYNYYADNLRAKILDEFEAINADIINHMQTEVKCEIAECLRSDNGGCLGHIRLKAAHIENPLDWLQAFIEEKLEYNKVLTTAFSDILHYRLNIEGLLEYKVNCALEYLDQESPLFARLPEDVYSKSVEDKADIIEQTLQCAIPNIAQSLIKGIQELLYIPSNSFKTRIRKLRERLFFNIEGKRALETFYHENAGSIWEEQFAAIAGNEAALKVWNEYKQELLSLSDKYQFVINLN